MSHRDAFEQLAERGTPIGATALLHRIEAGVVVEPRPTRRRWSGVAIAAAAFAVVLLLGGLWAFVFQPSDDAIGDPEGLVEIEWVEGPAPADRLHTGPGGFVASTFHTGDLWYSADGIEWEPVVLPGRTDLGAIQHVTGTDETWLIVDSGSAEPGVWRSDNGRSWEIVEPPADLRAHRRLSVAASDPLMGMAFDDAEVSRELWWSEDGSTWTPVSGLDIPDGSESPIVGPIDSGRGAVVCCDVELGSPELRLWISEDAVTWDEHTISLPDSAVDRWGWDLWSVEQLQGRWVAIGRSASLAGTLENHVWILSESGEWEYQLDTPFAPQEPALEIVAIDRAGERLVVTASAVDDGAAADEAKAWVTVDGITWHRATPIETTDTVTDVAIREVDGRLIGVWRGTPPNGVSVETTVALVADPDGIDPAGLEFQDEVLADGVVTLDELEQAFESWASCMLDMGMLDPTFEIGLRGAEPFAYEVREMSYGSEDRFAGEAEDAACRASWVDQVQYGPFGPEPEDGSGE